MVNFNDPAVLYSDIAALKKFLILVDGFYLWEFVTTLDYEWNVIRGRRQYPWSIWLYSFARVATLVTVAINIFNLDSTAPYNCQITLSAQFISAYLALVSSSLLIVLRIIAIWEWDRFIIAIATGTWGINIIFLIQGVTRFHAKFGLTECVANDLESIRLSTIAALVTDIILLSIMLVGLSRMRRPGSGTMALGRFLWNQGVVWLLIAVVAELTPTVFICLDLNEPLNLVFQIPWVITMSICATRMYRSLSDFLSTNIRQKTLPTDMSQASRSLSNMDEKPLGKPHGLTMISVGEHVASGRGETSFMEETV